jgi:hypothetical protein
MPKVIKSFHKINLDILFVEDLIVDESEYQVIYQDEDIEAYKPLSYRQPLNYQLICLGKWESKKN